MEKNEFTACLKVLEDTIEKKESFLTELFKWTKEQEKVLLTEPFSMDAFGALMDKKAPLIEKINEYDAGFEGVYKRMKPDVELFKTEFSDRLKKLQERIRKVLELGAAISTLEEQNRSRLESGLAEKKTEIRNFKRSNQTVSGYYKNMSGAMTDTSFFMDKKK